MACNHHGCELDGRVIQLAGPTNPQYSPAPLLLLKFLLQLLRDPIILVLQHLQARLVHMLRSIERVHQLPLPRRPLLTPQPVVYRLPSEVGQLFARVERRAHFRCLLLLADHVHEVPDARFSGCCAARGFEKSAVDRSREVLRSDEILGLVVYGDEGA